MSGIFSQQPELPRTDAISTLTEALPGEGGSSTLVDEQVWMNQPLQKDVLEALQTQPSRLPPMTSSSLLFASVQSPLQPPWPQTSVVLHPSSLVDSPTELLAEIARSLHHCLISKIPLS